MKISKKQIKANAAIEYLLIVAVVVGIVLVGFKTSIPKVRESSEMYFNSAVGGIVGHQIPCGPGKGITVGGKVSTGCEGWEP